jgi:ribose-phosphate pyrophosphokinase
MRQDAAFSAGEAISQAIVGRFLADLFDDVITVDPHLHRTHHLKDAVPAGHAVALSAAPAMSEFLRARPDTLLLGPDVESEQWVSSIAECSGLDHALATKHRLGDCEVRIDLPDLDMTQKSIVVIDDVISSGETIAMAAQQCLARDARRVDVLVTHPLFAPGAIERLQQAGVGEIWSSDSIPHPSNCIPLAELLAKAVRDVG